MARTHQRGKQLPVLYDRVLIFAIIGLMGVGLMMVASASIVISYKLYNTPFHYLIRQSLYLSAGLISAFIILRIEISVWQKISPYLLFVSFFLLIAVLIPGIGRRVNGSMRWIGFGPIGMQISEVVKLTIILYLSGYLLRRGDEVRQNFMGFLKPMAVLGLVAVLLLKQPDFGAAVVIIVTALGMMFLAGVRLWQYLVLILLVGIAFAVLAISSPYRMQRLTAFLNPWANPFQSGYQLTQSLIAFGRGGWWGVGLGESVQKLFYLPEAHTDFIFAVLGEELGLVGMLATIGLFSLFIFRALNVARKAQFLEEYFSAYVAYGIALWMGLQVVINIGVNTGLLPTKGLTLPLISYGGSSVVVFCWALAILLRIDHENRLLTYGFSKTRRK
ncbi:MAG: putative lipid II flippase FtsW [Legionellales bacterium]|nr:putative lipid II flippase FtsW [Legionellales bacterium]